MLSLLLSLLSRARSALPAARAFVVAHWRAIALAVAFLAVFLLGHCSRPPPPPPAPPSVTSDQHQEAKTATHATAATQANAQAETTSATHIEIVRVKTRFDPATGRPVERDETRSQTVADTTTHAASATSSQQATVQTSTQETATHTATAPPSPAIPAQPRWTVGLTAGLDPLHLLQPHLIGQVDLGVRGGVRLVGPLWADVGLNSALRLDADVRLELDRWTVGVASSVDLMHLSTPSVLGPADLGIVGGLRVIGPIWLDATVSYPPRVALAARIEF